MNKKKPASEYFHGKEKHNCAQSLAKAFGLSEDIISSYAGKGSGRAPGKICGSLFAAKEILKNPKDIVLLKNYLLRRPDHYNVKRSEN
jgi:hypothetical protein